jgi:AraC family transcriptional regulator
MTELLIKGMVCGRCVAVIRDGISTMGYDIDNMTLGKVRLTADPGKEGIKKIQSFLIEHGFELTPTRQSKIIQQVKNIINEALQNSIDSSKVKFSLLISQTLNMNYDSISELFSRFERITIERYVIITRVEKVKELLVDTEFTLTEIAHRTGFSSLNHLSRQFKEQTGLTPSEFRSARSTTNFQSTGIEKRSGTLINYIRRRTNPLTLAPVQL